MPGVAGSARAVAGLQRRSRRPRRRNRRSSRAPRVDAFGAREGVRDDAADRGSANAVVRASARHRGGRDRPAPASPAPPRTRSPPRRPRGAPLKPPAAHERGRVLEHEQARPPAPLQRGLPRAHHGSRAERTRKGVPAVRELGAERPRRALGDRASAASASSRSRVTRRSTLLSLPHGETGRIEPASRLNREAPPGGNVHWSSVSPSSGDWHVVSFTAPGQVRPALTPVVGTKPFAATRTQLQPPAHNRVLGLRSRRRSRGTEPAAAPPARARQCRFADAAKASTIPWP